MLGIQEAEKLDKEQEDFNNAISEAVSRGEGAEAVIGLLRERSKLGTGVMRSPHRCLLTTRAAVIDQVE